MTEIECEMNRFFFYFLLLDIFQLILCIFNANFKSEISFSLHALVFMQFETCDFRKKRTPMAI